MKTQIFPKIAIILILIFCSLNGYSGDLNIGSASVKITPPIGTPMAGYYYERGALSVHDDLFSKALVIEKDGQKVAMVSCDLVEVTATLVNEVRAIAQKLTGINADHIMIGATHSHTGPVIPSEAFPFAAKGKSAEILNAYIKNLPGLIAQSIKLANDALQPSVLSFGLGQEESISFNRRFFLKDGTVGWNPGKLNPLIIKPAGPIDPDVQVLFAETVKGKALCAYVNFAIHLDITGGQDISADMPYTLSKILGEVKSKDMTTIFSQGCCGNLNHFDVKNGAAQGGHAEAERIGAVLASEVLKTLTHMKSVAVTKISVKSEIVKLKLAEISDEEVPWALGIIAKYGESDSDPFIDKVKAYQVIEISNRKGKPIDAEVQVFALGDSCAIVSLPGEVFVELGMYIKSRSPYPHTIVVELANGSVDYIPDMKAFMEGNYEPVSARCAPGSGEILAKRVLEMLNNLKNK